MRAPSNGQIWKIGGTIMSALVVAMIGAGIGMWGDLGTHGERLDQHDRELSTRPQLIERFFKLETTVAALVEEVKGLRWSIDQLRGVARPHGPESLLDLSSGPWGR